MKGWRVFFATRSDQNIRLALTYINMFSGQAEGGRLFREVEGVPADRARAEADAAPPGPRRQGRPRQGQGPREGQEEVKR